MNESIPYKWLECDQRYLPLNYQAIHLIDLMMASDLSQHKLLRGTGLFYEDLKTSDVKLSPDQLCILIQNLSRLLPNSEISFRWGSRFWPGYAGACSQALGAAVNLNEALRLLQKFRYWLSPMLIPRIYYEGNYCYIQWLDAFGLGSSKRFMVETQMSALRSFISSRTPEACKSMHFGFSSERPESTAQHQVYLGDSLYFDVGVDMVAIRCEWLHTPWPEGSQSLSQLAEQQAMYEYQSQPQKSLIEEVRGYLTQHVRCQTGLNQIADNCGMSTATFKRKLYKHRLTFQQLQDEVRLNRVLYLMHVKGWTNEHIANDMNFGDTANFRRAFKRWTGRTPSRSRNEFQQKKERLLKQDETFNQAYRGLSEVMG